MHQYWISKESDWQKTGCLQFISDMLNGNLPKAVGPFEVRIP